MNTEIDIPNVTLTSVVGTTFRYGTPAAPAALGSQSTGIRSMRFMRKTQTKIVRDRGAISLLWPENASRTDVSTNSTIISIAAWTFPGRPVVAFFATLRKR